MALHHLPATEAYWNLKVTSLSELKRHDEVVETCHRGLNYVPSSARLRVYAGNALMTLNRYEDALASYEEAERLDRANAGALIGKGWALLSLRRYDEALATLDQAIQIAPNYAAAW
ncbi:MAG: tetratricopeptide repeat protein, partial [Ktedonobacterales bacterium]